MCVDSFNFHALDEPSSGVSSIVCDLFQISLTCRMWVTGEYLASRSPELINQRCMLETSFTYFTQTLYFNESFRSSDEWNQRASIHVCSVHHGLSVFEVLPIWPNCIQPRGRKHRLVNSVYHCIPPYLWGMVFQAFRRDGSGLATDSLCGVWGRGWTTCLLHDSPLFGSHFKMRVGM